MHAGLVPALRGLGHEIVVDRTEASRPGAGAGVDQFEERFPADAPHDATAFLDEAADWADVGRAASAARSDHVHAVALLHALPLPTPRVASTSWARYLASRCGERSSIRLGSLGLSSGLVDVLAADIAGERGGLALLYTHCGRRGKPAISNLLTIASYRAAGGVHEALARTAESVWSDLDEEERKAARHLLLRLVTRTGDRPPVAAHLSRRAIAGRSDVEAALDRLVAARLVTTDGDTVTLAHAMLATAWPRLSGWLDDSAGDRERIEHLQVSARGWEFERETAERALPRTTTFPHAGMAHRVATDPRSV